MFHCLRLLFRLLLLFYYEQSDKLGLYASGARQAASQMVDIYGIGGNPVALKSLHTQRLAIDWNITWEETLRIKNSNGNIIEINEPRNGSENKLLFDVGASYGVYKLLDRDPPHWSYNGH